MSQTSDAEFLKTFLMILAGLGVIGAVALIAAIWVIDASGLKDHNPLFAQEVVDERIAPVGQVRMPGDAAAAPAQDAPPAAVGPRPGTEIVVAACAACHQTGVMDAPKMGDRATWASRMDDGLAPLVASAIQGKGGMPPMGSCADCSEDEIHNAVVVLLKDSGIDAGEERSGPKSP